MGLEVGHGETRFTREFKLEAVRLIKERGVSYGRHDRAVNAAGAMKSSVPRFVRASSPAIEPTAPGGCGTTCLRRACRAVCIGSSD